jgi:protein phosphatase PTC7
MIDSWKRNQEVGSSTLVVVTLQMDGPMLHSSYVGDSGFCILRKAEDGAYAIVFQSLSQQRRFNFPMQLGWNLNGDSPLVAINGTHEVKSDDIVIVGSDGLLDNINYQQVECILSDS